MPLKWGREFILENHVKLTKETSDQPIRELELETVNNYVNKFI